MQKRLLIFIAMLFYMCVTSIWAQEGVPIIPLRDEYIREWLVLGPFLPKDLDIDFLADAGGEANIEPKEGDTVTTSDGEILTWKRHEFKTDIVNLLDATGGDNATVYAFCVLQSEIAGDAQIHLGSDSRIAVWINGKEVFRQPIGTVFRLDRDVFEVRLEAGTNRCMVKVAESIWSPGFAVRAVPPSRAVVSGVITNEADRPIPEAHVRLEQGGEEMAQAQTDASGNYRLSIYPVRGSYDLYATSGVLGDLRLGIPLREGERRTLNLTLRRAVSIEGTLLMLDDKTPHVAVPVQAVVAQASLPVKMGRPVATTLSDEMGKYQFVNLKPGRYRVRCQVLGGYVYYGEEKTAEPESQKAGRPENRTMLSEPIGLQVERGKTLENINFRFAPFKKGTWTNYDTLDGLAHNSVKDIYRDPDGVMWFATEGGGASRYDGKEFVNFTKKDGLAHSLVFAIHGDPDGVIWFGTNGGGVFRYDGRGMGDFPHFVNFTKEDGLVGDTVHDIHRDPDGVMWFATWDRGISRYDGETFVNLTRKELAAAHTWCIHRDPDGVMWLGTQDAGVFRYDGKEPVNFTKRDGLAGNFVYAIHSDPDGMMWFGTDGGVSRYDGKGMGDFPHFVNFTTKDGLVGKRVYAIHRDPDGVMWFGTNGGISRYDGRGVGDFPHFVNFTTEDGLSNNVVKVIHRDPDGVMWFGTGSISAYGRSTYGRGGVSRYDARAFVDFTTKDGLADNTVSDIHGDADGIMWFATSGGISRYDGRSVTMGDFPHFVNFTTKDGLAGNTVSDIHVDPDGIMWFATSNGVSRYDGKEFVNFTTRDGLVSNWVRDIYGDPDGVMWFGVFGGVSRYDGKEFVNFTKKGGSQLGPVLSVYGQPDGVMWVGTGVWGEGGLSRYDGKEFVNFTEKDGLPDNTIWDIYRDPDGIMWFATWGGVSRYDGRGMGDSPHFVNFTTEDGLAHNGVFAIHRDADGVMWFGTDGGGVSYYDGVAWTSLDTRDGLAGKSVSSIYQDSDGYLWFATDGGITRYRPSAAPPGIRIASIKVMEQLYEDLAAIPPIALGSHVTIEYGAIDLKTVPEKRQYRHRISETQDSRRKTQDSLGSREAYDPPTKRTSFDWTPKRPGTYIFEVQAIDRDLNYSEPASLELHVLPPPFYTRAGFIIGTILAAFFIPTGVYTGLLVRQKKQVFEPIPNPYVVGNPIRSKDMFFGRQNDFEFIRMKLGAGQAGLVIVFAGERRSGKTSILFQILNGELGERFVPVLMDMQAMAVDSEAEFLEKMASGINEALVAQAQSPAPTPTDFREGNPIRVFERFMAQTMEALDGKALLLLLDEYELIEAKIDDGVLRPDLITFFASLLEAHPRLSFIFTGSRHLEQRNVAYWRVLIGKSLYRHISFLSQRDALRLITKPVTDRVIYPRGIPERIVRLTAGQPFYTQVACQNMMDRLNEVQRNRVRQEDVDAVAQELADNPLPQMIYFWDGLESEQQTALSFLGEMLEDSAGYASAQMLLNFSQEQNLELELELSELERVLDELFVREVLERERAGGGQYEYRFRADLFRLWVRQAHSVWQARS
jgi:ligand-binding sensor domain-containing protein